MSKEILPEYLSVTLENNTAEPLLRAIAKEFEFPLTEADIFNLQILEDKFDQEKNCSGLAAPQIGISKRAIIFRVEDDENLKKWRSNLEQFMPKTIWINPLCTPIGEDTNDDYEGCFSVDNVAGLVTRANKISYSAMDIDGNTITGEAKGFLARVIQHEIDHLNGVLFIDLAKAENILDIEEYRRLRAAAINAENSNSNDAQN